jgi:hypothetical protein
MVEVGRFFARNFIFILIIVHIYLYYLQYWNNNKKIWDKVFELQINFQLSCGYGMYINFFIFHFNFVDYIWRCIQSIENT